MNVMNQLSLSDGRARKAPTVAGMSGILGILALGAASLAGCGLIDANIFDTTVTLQTQTYQQDFGSNMGTVPSIPCSNDNVCGAVSAMGATGRCDMAAKTCYADASVTLPYPLTLSKDSSFQSGIGQKLVQSVRGVDLAYTVPSNTMTFAMPEISVYVGPQSAKLTTDSGVALIGKIPPLAAKQTLTTPGVLKVTAGTPAYSLLFNAITTPSTPIVFLLAANPRVNAGQPVPAGAIQVNVTPSLIVGLPR